jgi:GTP pyrophosphokinase
VNWGALILSKMCFLNLVVSVECVNVCKSPKWDGSGRYDCSALSCAWKAPRALTGFLACTAHPPQCFSSSYGRNGRRNRSNSVKFLDLP